MSRQANPEDLAFFYSHLARLLGRGAPLPTALRELVGAAQTPAVARDLAELAAMVERGDALATAMARFPACFEPACLPLIESAVEQDTLPETLRDLARFSRLKPEPGGGCTSSFGSTLLLTAIIVGMALAVCLFIVPSFEKMFYEMLAGEPLPPLTEALIWLSHLCRAWWPLLTMAPLALGFAGLLLWQGRQNLPGFYLLAQFLPGLSAALRHTEYARVCALLAAFLRRGKTLGEGLEAAALAVRGRRLRRRLQHWAGQANSGLDAFILLADDRRADPLLRVAMAETPPDRLVEELDALVVLYSNMVDTVAEDASTLLSAVPLITFVVFVGATVFAMLLPLIKLIDALGGG